jgi:hypothetical protein
MSATLKKFEEIWTGPESHIAFAINADGVMDYRGFTGQVLKHWPEMDKIGPQPFGAVHSKMNVRIDTGPKILHAMTCRTSRDLSQTPSFITACLDMLRMPDGTRVPDNHVIAVLLPGAGQIGRSQGADVNAIYDAIVKSKKACVVYTYSRELTRR